MKTKNCPKCELDLPLEAFTSTRAKYCEKCKIIRKMEQQKASRQRQIERLKTQKKKVTSKKKEKTIAQLKKQAQRVFNAWIRERDNGEPCLACKNYADKMDASHYIAQGSSGYLRYNEDNVHNTCYSCNRFKHGNLVLYRINLVKKIGKDRVEWLEDNVHKIHTWTREELLEIIERYK